MVNKIADCRLPGLVIFIYCRKVWLCIMECLLGNIMLFFYFSLCCCWMNSTRFKIFSPTISQQWRKSREFLNQYRYFMMWNCETTSSIKKRGPIIFFLSISLITIYFTNYYLLSTIYYLLSMNSGNYQITYF